MDSKLNEYKEKITESETELKGIEIKYTKLKQDSEMMKENFEDQLLSQLEDITNEKLKESPDLDKDSALELSLDESEHQNLIKVLQHT